MILLVDGSKRLPLGRGNIYKGVRRSRTGKKAVDEAAAQAASPRITR